MKKPVFCINRLRHFRTAIFVADAMFALLCLLTVFPIADATDRAAAEVNGDEYSLTVGTNDEVRVSIAPEHDGKMSVMKDSVTTSTNAPTGYKLYISSANTYNSMLLDGEEYNDEDIWAKMAPTEGSFEQPAALFVSDDTPATWGYAIPGLNNFDSEYTTSDPSASSKFAAMPTAGNGQLIRSIDTAIEGDSIDVYYGTKVSSLLRQGKYKIWVNYIAVTEISSEIDNEVSILPRRVRNNYKPGTRITFSSDFRIAPDLGVIQPTVNGLSCDNIIRVSDDPFIFTCELPAGLTNGTYPVSVEIPQLGKHYNAIENLTIVDPYDEMQGVDKEVYDSVMVNDEYQFYDARDDKKYWITKTNGGDLLMTQNLDFAISTEGTVLDPATSNVQNEKTIAASEVPGDGIKDPTKFYYFDAGDYYLDITIGEQVSSAELDVEAPEWHYHLGSRYSVSTVYTDAVTNTDDADE